MDWWYSFKEIPNKDVNYAKGIGRWTKNQLQTIIQKDGLENMIKPFEKIDEKLLDEWLAKDKTDKRKEYIKKATFNLDKI